MKDHDARAFAGTALVTLLAIAGFCCIVATPPPDAHAGWQHTEARAELERDAARPVGESQ